MACDAAGVHIMQLISRRMSPRAMLLPPVVGQRTISPSYFEAPGAANAVLPNGLHFVNSAKPQVTIAFCCPSHYGDLLELDSALAQQALAMYCATVRCVTLPLLLHCRVAGIGQHAVVLDHHGAHEPETLRNADLPDPQPLQ